MTNGNKTVRAIGLAALTLAIMTAAQDARASDRKGFVFGVAVGGGGISCDDCDSLHGPASSLYAGGMLTDKLALVADSSVVVKTEDGNRLTSGVFGVAAQYWVAPRVWVKGGVGGGQLFFSSDQESESSDLGLGFLGGAGVEIVQKKKFALDLQARFTTASIEDLRFNTWSVLFGFNLN
jgi:hypothetical protein